MVCFVSANTCIDKSLLYQNFDPDYLLRFPVDEKCSKKIYLSGNGVLCDSKWKFAPLV